MKKFRIIAAAAATAMGLCFSAGCSSEQGFMGNTGEVALEEGDIFSIIHVMDYGDITVKLFPAAAPTAVKNFISRAESGFYDGRTFHRVVKDQLVQGGSMTGTGFDGQVSDREYFSSETSQYMCHYFGALCMAKSDKGNYCQFYMVSNSEPADIDKIIEKLDEDLNNTEITDKMLDEDKEYYRNYCNKLKSIPDAVKERYSQVGGIYDYDGEDTVFGQLVDGADVLKAINSVETVFGNNNDDKSEIPSKPLDEIVIEKIEVVRIAPAETTVADTEKSKPSRTTSETQQVIVEGGGNETKPAETNDTSDTGVTAGTEEQPVESNESESAETPSTVNSEEQPNESA